VKWKGWGKRGNAALNLKCPHRCTVDASKNTMVIVTQYVSEVFVTNSFLYGYERWCFTRRLRVFENRLRRVFGLKREEMAVGWRRLYNEELHNL
jgi:hypothetical protein